MHQMKNPKTTPSSRIHRLCLIVPFRQSHATFKTMKNVTLFAKLFFSQQKIKHQQTLTVTGFSNVTRHTPNVTPV